MAKLHLDNVTVEYPIYNASSMSLRNQLVALGTGGRMAQQARRIVTITALDGVTLELNDGDRIGLVGHNGSGKTTLLRTLAGIYTPTKGRILIEGKVSTVFGLGAGVDPELSGYENIVRMSMLLGATHAQATARIPEIQEFTELGDFLSVPFRTYSAGMLLRLAFAIATLRQPEILLLDEIIGVGDASFMAKAKARLQKMVHRAQILVVSSHSDFIIRDLCEKAIWLDKGNLAAFGAVDHVLAAYKASVMRPVG